MGIEATFGAGSIADRVAAFQKRLEAATIYMLKYMGESLITYAKEQRSYTDQSGNLTNSIGYVIVQSGDPIHYGGFIQPGDGADAGLKVALKMAKNAPNSFSLIILAGMNYAACVEAKGYNVILPAELKAKKDFPAAISKLKEQARSKAIELFGVAA